jgi:ABC-2 type transport system ATP-binding protein
VSDLAIVVDRLAKTYRRARSSEVKAVDDLTFNIERGTIFGLLGPNGAGKTTTLRVLTTLTRPTSGRVTVLGYDVVSNALDVRRRIGVVIQAQAAELLLTVRENLLTFARFHGNAGAGVVARADEVITRFGLSEVAETKVQDLSGGIRRRVQVAKMFMADLPVLFLDEFSTGMDPILKRDVMDLLRREASRGRTIVLTTQILTEAEELCDDILILDRGRQIARGNMHALKMLVDRLYDVSLTFDGAPGDIRAIVSGYDVMETHVVHHTIRLKVRDEGSRVLDLVAALARHGRVVQVEVGGATLEDIFIELTRRAGGQP